MVGIEMLRKKNRRMGVANSSFGPVMVVCASVFLLVVCTSVQPVLGMWGGVATATAGGHHQQQQYQSTTRGVKGQGDVVVEGRRLGALVLLATVLLNVVERLVTEWKIPDNSERQRDVRRDVEMLKREAARLNAPDTFAACAKAERKAISLEKELAKMEQRDEEAKRHYLVKMPGMVRMLVFVALLGLLLLGRVVGTVGFLEPAIVWPLGRWLSALSGHSSSSGVVGLLPWSMLCHRVSRMIVMRR